MAVGTIDQSVPVAQSIEAVYPPEAVQTQQKRWSRLSSHFSEIYGHSPNFIARSPGRVNIIGEHIDYSLYEVLPMAIAADVIIAVSTSKATEAAKVNISNIDPNKFKSSEFTISASGEVEIDPSTHEWTNYFKAGVRGAMGLLREKASAPKACSMKVLIDGTVPSGGGLSSSAAFVCASALAVLRANGQKHVLKKELVELAIVSERAVGVNSGGMDQAASVFSIRGDALSVSFSPQLHAEAIAFPKTDPAITFMIAQSFVAADKHVTAPVCYNLRVVECTLAAEVLASKLKLKLKDDSGPLGRSLRGLEDAYFSGEDSLSPVERLKKMRSLVTETLSDKSGYTREQIADSLDTSVADLEKRFMEKFPVRAERFLLQQRALHVFEEALRVSNFKSLLQSAPSEAESHEDLLKKLGDLMNQTQDSCRDLYDCSCPELDELCMIARKAGAYGSRLTGAGWGGCSVHLVPKDKVDAIRSAWEKDYYHEKFSDISEGKLGEAIVTSEPGHGSMIIELSC
ncbi:galactokinase [Lasallia pustulata]|uniref:Galactokinase n=1 Tax=Lasallia pustulata TaxID=136370 RepID=A0A1W5D2J7_9LECA|nr:galactokinase [Lasallia pustulata]